MPSRDRHDIEWIKEGIVNIPHRSRFTEEALENYERSIYRAVMVDFESCIPSYTPTSATVSCEFVFEESEESQEDTKVESEELDKFLNEFIPKEVF